MQDTINKNLLKYAASQAIVCPNCGEIMDTRQTVLVTIGDTDAKSMTRCCKCWDIAKPKLLAILEGSGVNLDVLDGRDVFPLTQAEVRKACKAAGCTLKIVDGEYQVTLNGESDLSTYYTNNAMDAIGTAQAMWNHKVHAAAQAKAQPVKHEAFAAIILGTQFGVGLAERDQSGYYPQVGLGVYTTYELASARADELNKQLGLTPEEAAQIVCSSMRKQNKRGR